MVNESKDGRRVQTVQTAFELIQRIQCYDGVTLTELANEHEASKSTVYNHLRTLVELGYIYRADKEYYLGLRFLSLGRTALDNVDLLNYVEPEAQELADRVGGRVVVMIEQAGRGVNIYQCRAEDAVMTNTDIGETIPFHCTALGKAYLSGLSQREADAIIDRIELVPMAANTITSREQLRAEVERTRERGYSINDEERVQGMRAIGAPIVNERDEVLGSISVSLPITKMKGQLLEDTVPLLIQETASVIMVKMTYE